MIFVPIWPKNDIRLEEHDFSNFLFFPDRLEHGLNDKNQQIIYYLINFELNIPFKGQG